MERRDPREDAIVTTKLHEVARRNRITLVRAFGQAVIAHNHEFTKFGIRMKA